MKFNIYKCHLRFEMLCTSFDQVQPLKIEIGACISKHTLYKYKSTFINVIQGLMYVYEFNKFDLIFIYLLFFYATLFVERQKQLKD